MRRRALFEGGPRIELLPLLDVVFLVLVAFVYSVVAMVRSHSIEVDLPSFRSASDQELSAVLLVNVRSDGTLFADGEELGPEELVAKLAAMRRSDAATAVLLQADVSASYGAFAEVLDLVRAAGQEKILLAGVPGDDEPPE